MFIFLSILIVLACLMLIIAVLIQKSKGGGLASNYSSGNQLMGYRKTTDFIEKATWSLAIFICVVSILSAFTVKTAITSSVKPATPAATTAPAAAPSSKPAATPKPAAQPAAKPAAEKAAPAPAAAPAAEKGAK